MDEDDLLSSCHHFQGIIFMRFPVMTRWKSPPLHGFYAQTPGGARRAPLRSWTNTQAAAALRPVSRRPPARAAQPSPVRSLKQDGPSAEFSCRHELILTLLPSDFREKTHREVWKSYSADALNYFLNVI